MTKLLKPTTADKEIEECLLATQSFSVVAGAGSGKTTSLVTALNFLRDEVGSNLRKNGQKIVAYRIDPDSGGLTELNSQETGGANPCHVSVGPDDQYVVYANYTGGSCGLIPLASDGSLEKPASFFQHQGGSEVNVQRQGEPHPHSAKTDPSGKFVVVPDLGQDKVRIYRLGKNNKSMKPNAPDFATMPAGGGPRHVSFNANGRWMYVNNELTSAVTVFEFDKETGSTKALQTITTLPWHKARRQNHR